MSEKQSPMIAVSTPMSGEAGATGSWRARRPVIGSTACRTCQTPPRECRICWLYCPEPAIAPGRPPVIDYTYCKGCGICAKECPAGAIEMLPEDPVGPTPPSAIGTRPAGAVETTDEEQG